MILIYKDFCKLGAELSLQTEVFDFTRIDKVLDSIEIYMKLSIDLNNEVFQSYLKEEKKYFESLLVTKQLSTVF